MQVPRKKYERLVRAIAPSGNLFFLLAIQELRRQGITFLAFYVLERCVEELEISQHSLRRESLLEDYELSRACTVLADSDLIEVNKSSGDARVRLVRSTARVRRVHKQVLSAAARRLEDGIPIPGRLRRLSEATECFRKGNRMLLGPLQLSFFDTELLEEGRPKKAQRKAVKTLRARGQSKRSKP